MWYEPRDPIIRTLAAIFPAMFDPLNEMPAELRSHIRYPIDFFTIQSNQLLIYHMTDPQVFYNREDQWRVPVEIYGGQPQQVESYYLIMRLPNEDAEEFIILHPFTPASRNNLIAWLAVPFRWRTIRSFAAVSIPQTTISLRYPNRLKPELIKIQKFLNKLASGTAKDRGLFKGIY
uniref:UPF0182 family protein n=1 Tax=Desertifilum tharense IPPAS B-1220 TaxID=1781255 RepID=A0ACD5GX77_9CYAN